MHAAQSQPARNITQLGMLSSLWLLGTLAFAGWSASSTFPLLKATLPFETVPNQSLGSAVGVRGPLIAGRASHAFEGRLQPAARP